MKEIIESIDRFALLHPGLIPLVIVVIFIAVFLGTFIWDHQVKNSRYRYIVQGKAFYTFEDVNYYYQKQLDRKIKWVYLMVYDTEKEEYIFRGDFSHFTKEYITQNDRENER